MATPTAHGIAFDVVSGGYTVEIATEGPSAFRVSVRFDDEQVESPFSLYCRYIQKVQLSDTVARSPPLTLARQSRFAGDGCDCRPANARWI